MSSNEIVRDIFQCPICNDTMKKPIIQCQRGHSLCLKCKEIKRLLCCPICNALLTSIRNTQLEQLIEQLPKTIKFACKYKDCKYLLSIDEKSKHEIECKKRIFSCEGYKFAGWKCSWIGRYTDILAHFQDDHNDHEYSYKTQINLDISIEYTSYDIKIIQYLNGYQLFWYKNKIDIEKSKIFWIIQFIGTENEAKHYYYEFEINNGPISKFKFTDICTNDCCDIEEVFNFEKCVVLSFQALENYKNDENELSIKFSIMYNKHT